MKKADLQFDVSKTNSKKKGEGNQKRLPFLFLGTTLIIHS